MELFQQSKEGSSKAAHMFKLNLWPTLISVDMPSCGITCSDGNTQQWASEGRWWNQHGPFLYEEVLKSWRYKMTGRQSTYSFS